MYFRQKRLAELINDSKPLPETMLSYEEWGNLTATWETRDVWIIESSISVKIVLLILLPRLPVTTES